MSKHCDSFQYGVHVMDLPVNDLSTPVVLLTTCSKPLAVSHHSYKILVLSALGHLVSERNNNSFSSVNSPLRGLYCIQLRLCEICSEWEAFDCCIVISINSYSSLSHAKAKQQVGHFISIFQY